MLVAELADDRADDRAGKGKKQSPGGAKEAWRGSALSCKVKAVPDTQYEIFLVAHNVIGPGVPAPSVFAKTPQQQAAPVKLKPPPRLAAPTGLEAGERREREERRERGGGRGWKGNGQGMERAKEGTREPEGRDMLLLQCL